MKYLILFLLILPSTISAQRASINERPIELTEKDVDAIEQEINNINLDEFNTSTGVVKNGRTTANDQNLLGLRGFMRPLLTDLTAQMGYEVSYAHLVRDMWIEAFANIINAKFRTIGDPSQLTGDREEINETSESINSFGLGFGYRSHYIQGLLDNKRLGELISAYLTYYSMSEAYTQTSYSGVGIRTDFGIFHRSSESTQLAMRLSYNLAPLTHAPEFEGQTHNERSLTLSWVSLGVDLSFYF